MFLLAGFEVGVVEFGAVMEAFERGGKPERVLETFDEMVRGGHVFLGFVAVLVGWWLLCALLLHIRAVVFPPSSFANFLAILPGRKLRGHVCFVLCFVFLFPCGEVINQKQKQFHSTENGVVRYVGALEGSTYTATATTAR